MKHRLRVGVLSTIFVLFVLPVLISQLFTPEGRTYSGVRLADTQYREIRFQNKAQNIGLGGMLFVPQGEGPFPAVVIIHDSVKIYQHSGHALETPQGHGNSIFREDALADISDFILSASSSPLSAAK